MYREAPSEPDLSMVLVPSCVFTHNTEPFNPKAKSSHVGSSVQLLPDGNAQF